MKQHISTLINLISLKKTTNKNFKHQLTDFVCRSLDSEKYAVFSNNYFLSIIKRKKEQLEMLVFLCMRENYISLKILAFSNVSTII